MLVPQVIDPHVLRDFILLHQDFLRPKFPEPKITSKRGGPRIGLRWVMIAICVFGHINNIVWKDLPPKLRLCNFLIEEKYLGKIPCKSTFNKYWDDTSQFNLESWIRMLGHSLGSKKDHDTAIDSSGFELIVGSFWRLVKWRRRAITTSSKIFCKVHIAVAVPSRAIIGIETSKITVHDSVSFGPLWKHMYVRVIKRIRRVHLDKAYWSENINNFLD